MITAAAAAASAVESALLICGQGSTTPINAPAKPSRRRDVQIGTKLCDSRDDS